MNDAFQGYVFDTDEHVDILGLLGHLSDVLRSLKQVPFLGEAARDSERPLSITCSPGPVYAKTSIHVSGQVLLSEGFRSAPRVKAND